MENNTNATQKRGLGRGLAALLGGDDEVQQRTTPTPATIPLPTPSVKTQAPIVEQKVSVEPVIADPKDLEAAVGSAGPYKILSLSVDKINAKSDQPRQHFSDAKLQELAESICEQGLIQPIVVRRVAGIDGAQSYQIVAGERRWRACKMLGMTEMPVIIREDAEQSDKADLASVIENIQRVELNPVELAEAYSKILKLYSFTQEELAKKLGVSRVSVANTLRLIKLPESVKDFVVHGKLSEGHARALLTLEKEEDISALANDIITQGLNVREVEARVREKIQGPLAVQAPKTFENQPSAAPIKEAPKSAETLATEEELRSLFGTKAILRGNAKGGTIELYYSNEDSLHRLLHQLRSVKSN